MGPDASIFESSLRQGAVAAWVLARTLGMSASAPGWRTTGLPWRARIVWGVALAAIVAPGIAPGAGSASTVAEFARIALIEGVIGVALGMSAGLILAAARQAGELVGQQAGFSASSLLDPESGEESNPLGRLFGWIALGTFLVADGPARLARVLIESYRLIPLGGLGLTIETASRWFGRVEDAFALALRIAAPVGLALWTAGLALALISRAAPAFPFWSLAWPVRLGLGLFLTALGLVALASSLSDAWGDWFSAGWNFTAVAFF